MKLNLGVNEKALKKKNNKNCFTNRFGGLAEARRSTPRKKRLIVIDELVQISKLSLPIIAIASAIVAWQ